MRERRKEEKEGKEKENISDNPIGLLINWRYIQEKPKCCLYRFEHLL